MAKAQNQWLCNSTVQMMEENQCNISSRSPESESLLKLLKIVFNIMAKAYNKNITINDKSTCGAFHEQGSKYGLKLFKKNQFSKKVCGKEVNELSDNHQSK